jgi:DNA-binding SARP family transcriptional activator/DNA-binding beta-propeller fold protein YncE
MDFRILGPLEVDREGRALPLGGRQQRELLALLLLHANEVVPLDEIIDELWPEAPPPSATRSIHALVSRLRRLLEGDSVTQNEGEGDNCALLTRARGYVLRVAPGELDLHRFELLLREGRDAVAAGQADVAARTLREALAVWRGPALAEFGHDSFAVAEIARLNELRLTALEERIEADLAAGRSAELVAELEALVAAQPLRERLRVQLMLALYRADRQAEALEAYRHARQVLVEELGIEPSPALKELEKAILAQDPALAPPPARLPEEEGPLARHAQRRRRRRKLVFGIAVGLVTIGAVGAALQTRREATVDVRPNSVAVIDPGSNKVVGDILVGREPAFVAAAGEHVWVGNRRDRNLTRIDPDGQRRWPTVNIPLDARPAALIAGPNAAWVVTAGGRLRLARFDPRYEWPIRGPVGIGAEFSTSKVGAAVWGGGLTRTPLAFGDATIWTLGGLDGSLTRRDPTTLARHGRVQLPDLATAIAAGSDATWVATKSNGLLRIDPDTNRVVDEFPAPTVPVDIAVDAHAVWIASEGDDVVARVDPTTRSQISISVGDGPTAIAYGFGSVWVACKGDGTVWRIDPATHKVVKHWKLGASPEDIAAGAGAVWAAVYSKLEP